MKAIKDLTKISLLLMLVTGNLLQAQSQHAEKTHKKVMVKTISTDSASHEFKYITDDGEEVIIKSGDAKVMILGDDNTIETFDLKAYDLGDGNIDTTIIKTDEHGNQTKVKIKRHVSTDGDDGQTVRKKVMMIKTDNGHETEEVDIEVDIDKILESLEIEEDGNKVIVKSISAESDEEAEKIMEELGIEMPEGKVVKKHVVIAKMVYIEDIDEELLEKNTKIKAENDLPVENMKLFPNPNNGQFEVRFKLREKGKTILRVYDMEGQEVLKERISTDNAGAVSHKIDLTSFGKGVYVLQISQGDKQFNKKIMVQ